MNKASLFRFFFVFGILAAIISTLLYRVLKKRLGLSPSGNSILLIFFISTALLMVTVPFLYRTLNFHHPIERILQFTQYILMGWMAIALITFVGIEVVQLIYQIFIYFFMPSLDASRRIFVTEGVARGLLAGTAFASFGGYLQAQRGPKVIPITIGLKTLPPEFSGLRIAQISDVHIGPLIQAPFLNKVVDQVLELDADLVFITGDLVDGSVEQLKEHIEPLRRLKARDGIYFCTGNHEYYSGAEEWIAYLETLGIHVFRNTNKVFTKKTAEGKTVRLLIGGVYDWQGERFHISHRTDPFEAAKTNQEVDCKILLAHNPFSIEGAASAGFDLQISGHTHAGQFYPFAWLIKFYLKHVQGLYQINEKTQLYVNQGTGYWGPPNRLGIPGEITHFTLQRMTT